MKLSVITPSYNQAPYIEKTIQSVIAEKNTDIEFIICDGRSTDGTRNILEKYRKKIDYLVIEQDAGQADALVKGFSLATGDVLCYLNSDDVILPGTLEYVLDYFKRHRDIDMIYSHRLFINEDGELKRFWILPPHSNYCMMRWDFIPQETCFWRRDIMDEVGGIDSTFDFAMDYDLFSRIMKKGRIIRVNKFLSAFRVHPKAKSTLLYETKGREEVRRVRYENSIEISWYDHILKYFFGGGILAISFIFKLLFLKRMKRRIEFNKASCST